MAKLVRVDPPDAPPASVIAAVRLPLLTFLIRLIRGLRRVPGAKNVTSWWRSEDKNREVGGAADSQHRLGLAVDLVVVPGAERRAVQELNAAGLVAIDEGSHIHVQLLPAGQARRLGLFG